jgi:hypothetical protein
VLCAIPFRACGSARAGQRMSRCSLAGWVAIGLAAEAMTAAVRADAFFSATGTFTASVGQFEDFNFSLPGGANNLTLRTWAYAGGTNATGVGIGSAGIDSTLNLFAGGIGGASIAFNDDNSAAAAGPGGSHFDSLLAWNGVGNTLLSPQPGGSYRLRMANVGSNIGDGHWAVDLVSTAGGNGASITGIVNSASSILNNLTFGNPTGAATISLSSGNSVILAGQLSVARGGFISLNGGTLIDNNESVGALNGLNNLIGQSAGLHKVLNQVSFGGGTNNLCAYQLDGGTFEVGEGEIEGAAAGSVVQFNQTGGLHVADGAGFISIGDGAGSVGTYSLSGGTLSAFNVDMGNGGGVGALIQTGGAINTTLLTVIGASTYNLSGGSATMTGGFVSGAWAISNGATAVATGSVQVNAGGTLQISGGALSASAITLNSGGTVVFSSGTVALTNSSLTIAPGGLLGGSLGITPSKMLSVSGTTTVGFGGSLFVNSTTFSTGSLAVGSGGQFFLSNGTLQLTGSGLTVGLGAGLGSTLDLQSGQFIDQVGSGTTNVVTASGLLYFDGGSARMSGTFNNVGAVQFASPLSALFTNTFNNSGLLTGTGRVVSTSLTNQGLGEIRVGAADTLRINGTVTNAGTINLLGGQLDVQGPFSSAGAVNLDGGMLHFTTSANNTGRISGRGVINGDVGIVNGGTIALSGGASDLHGMLTNNRTVVVAGNSTATFYDAVNNTGTSGFQVSANSTAVFLGPVTGLGNFTGGGVKDFESGGSGGAITTVLGGTIVGPGAPVTASYVRDNWVQVDGLLQAVPNGTPASVSRVNTLTVSGSTDAWQGRFDLADNGLVIDYTGASPISTVTNQLKSGYAGGAWTGTGIASSTGAADAQHRTGLGVAEATDLFNAFPAIFLGQSVDSTALLMRYTLFGDANLDGTVDTLDFNALAANFGKGGQRWSKGDFNYDGQVDTLDFNYLASNFGQHLSEPATGVGSLVPEPGAMALLGLIPLLAKRRRRNQASAPCALRR